MESPSMLPLRVAFTKMPTVPPVVPALKVSVDPVPLRVPRPVLERAHAYEMVPGHVEVQVAVAVKSCWPPAVTVGPEGATDTDVRVMGLTVISVNASLVEPLSVALTKMPTVPVVTPALKVSELPLPLIVPSVVLLSAHAYAMFPGHVALQLGVAVNSWEPLVPTVGTVGLSATDERVTGFEVTVIMANVPFVTPLRVALTKRPTVPATVPELKVSVAPLPLRVPRVVLLRAQVYVVPEGYVEVHIGVAVKSVPVLVPTVGVEGLRETEVNVDTMFPMFATRPLALSVPQPVG